MPANNQNFSTQHGEITDLVDCATESLILTNKLNSTVVAWCQQKLCVSDVPRKGEQCRTAHAGFGMLTTIAHLLEDS